MTRKVTFPARGLRRHRRLCGLRRPRGRVMRGRRTAGRPSFLLRQRWEEAEREKRERESEREGEPKFSRAAKVMIEKRLAKEKVRASTGSSDILWFDHRVRV